MLIPVSAARLGAVSVYLRPECALLHLLRNLILLHSPLLASNELCLSVHDIIPMLLLVLVLSADVTLVSGLQL